MKRVLISCLLLLFLSGCTVPGGTDPTPASTPNVSLSDMTFHFTITDDTLVYGDKSVAGYTDASSDTLAERISEARDSIGVLSSVYIVDLTFTDTPPESITLISKDRYGSGPEVLISDPSDTVTVSPQIPYGYFAHSGLEYEWYLRIICSYPDRDVEYVLVMEKNVPVG